MWSKSQLVVLKTMWNAGLSAAKVAAVVGKSRNAVISKTKRTAGLIKHDHYNMRVRRQFARIPVSSEPRPDYITIYSSLEPSTCRWPFGDPQVDGFSLCGAAASGTYCAYHTALSRKGESIEERMGGPRDRLVDDTVETVERCAQDTSRTDAGIRGLAKTADHAGLRIYEVEDVDAEAPVHA